MLNATSYVTERQSVIVLIFIYLCHKTGKPQYIAEELSGISEKLLSKIY